MTGQGGALTARVRLDASAIRPAAEPPEERGLARDHVRLLVAEPHRLRHRRFRDLPRLLAPGDLVVVNDSATLPAAVEGRRRSGDPVVLHFATPLHGRRWRVELRRPDGTGPVRDARRGEVVDLPGGATLTLADGVSARPDHDSGRLWEAALELGDAPTVEDYLRDHGRPITYAYLRGRWPLEAYQTVFARRSGSAEMASAARPFTDRLVTQLVVHGVRLAPVTLHAGVSSLEAGEAPPAERFTVPAPTAALVEQTRRAGGRIVAVGTTVTRALETVTDVDGRVRPGAGWTDLVLGPRRPARIVDGLVTGWHAPGASHLQLLEAVAGHDLVQRAYDAALASGYRWHEFGDSALFLPRPVAGGPQGQRRRRLPGYRSGTTMKDPVPCP